MHNGPKIIATLVLASALFIVAAAHAQVSWWAELSNPNFPGASGKVTATVPADTITDPYVYFKTEWSGISPIDRTMVHGEFGGWNVADTLVSGAEWKWPIAWYPSANLDGYDVEINKGYYQNQLYGTLQVPEPSTYALLTGLGLVAFGAVRRLRKGA